MIAILIKKLYLPKLILINFNKENNNNNYNNHLRNHINHIHRNNKEITGKYQLKAKVEVQDQEIYKVKE